MIAQGMSLTGTRADEFVLSDYLVMAGFGLALLFALDPLDWALDQHRLTKHIPFALLLAGCWLTAIGIALHRRPSVVVKPDILYTVWPLLVLSAWVVAGSLYARFVRGFPNTFLVTGLYLLAVPLTAYLVARAKSGLALARLYQAALIGCGLFITVGLLLTLEERRYPYPFHELEFMVMPLAVYCFLYQSPHKLCYRVLAWTFLFSGILFLKNTGFLISLLTAVYMLAFVWGRRIFSDPAFRRKFVVGFCAAVVLLSVVVALLLQREDLLPSGNLSFRLLTYELAWNKFLGSPVWGTSFTEPASQKFLGFDTGVPGNVLPSHSDLLDLLAHGGVIAFGLLVLGYWRIAAMLYRCARRRTLSNRELAMAHTAACISLAGVIVYAFNPVMLQPVKSLLLWTSAGIVLGLALRAVMQGAETP